MIRLSSRLAAIAQLAENGKRLIDVGTDHGYIPVYFAQRGGMERIAASDIHKDPLKKAMASAEEYGVGRRIEFFLSDGLAAVDGDFDTVVIAGMGGETIAGILSGVPWVKDGVRFVLQPQSKLPELCAYLSENGFSCRDARLIKDAGKLYTAFSAVGTGGGGFDLLKCLARRGDPLLPEALRLEREKLLRALSGMEKGGRADSGPYKKLQTELIRINKTLEEVTKCGE